MRTLLFIVLMLIIPPEIESQSCSPGWYFNNVIRRCTACSCYSNGVSNPSCRVYDGVCTCNKGYTGRKCARCDVGYYWNGISCTACICTSGSQRVYGCTAGGCSCKTGFPPCNKCVDEYYLKGGTCTACNCHRNGARGRLCDAGGQCSCSTGYTGNQCDQCTSGYYKKGYICADCDCDTNGARNEECKRDGKCECNPGYWGDKCDNCVQGYYRNGQYCTKCPCNSIGTSTCTNDGKCNCKSGFAGTRCDACDNRRYPLGSCTRICREGNYISAGNCLACNCDLKGAWGKSCYANGQCICKAGFTGNQCDSCITGYTGNQCNQCTSGYYWKEGSCKACSCYSLGKLNGSCDASGQCACKIGYTGKRCQQCANGYYWKGGYCTACNCSKDGATGNACNYYYGQCNCENGYEGLKCNQCKQGYYKTNKGCIDCKCSKIGAQSTLCDDSGQCECEALFIGKRCTNCVFNYDFNQTAKQCIDCGCHVNRTTRCTPGGFCQCKQGYEGEKCESIISSPGKSAGDSIGMVAGGSVAGILFILIIVVVLIWFVKFRGRKPPKENVHAGEPLNPTAPPIEADPAIYATPSHKETTLVTDEMYTELGAGGGRLGPRQPLAESHYREAKIDDIYDDVIEVKKR